MQCLQQPWLALRMQTLFFVAYESQYTSVTSVFEKPCNMDVYIHPWLLVLKSSIILWCLRVYKCNWAAREIYISSQRNINQQPEKYKSNNQTFVKSYFMRTYKYVFGCWQSIWRSYIYVFGYWSAVRVGADIAQGRIYTSLAVGKISLGTQRVNACCTYCHVY